MKFIETPIKGVCVLELEPHKDERGEFARVFCVEEFAKAGLTTDFPQWSISRNTRRGTLRGMHFNKAGFEEIKLVRCTRGAVFDVVVDLRRSSPTFCHWFGVELNEEEGRMLYIPAGLAHGFQTLRDNSELCYHISRLYEPDSGRGVRWDDPAFGIKWPETDRRIMSDRDAEYEDYQA